MAHDSLGTEGAMNGQHHSGAIAHSDAAAIKYTGDADQLHKDTIVKITTALNEALTMAFRHGLRVEVAVHELPEIGKQHPRIYVQPTISRVL